MYGVRELEIRGEEHVQAAQDGLEYVRKQALSGKWDVVILDEINNAVDLDLISVNAVLEMLDQLPQNVDVILTGRSAPKEFIECADIVSEIKEVKHPYNKGKTGGRGVEW